MATSTQEPSPASKKTIIFVCLNAISHVNSVLLMANHLRDQGHRAIFLFNKPFPSKLDRLGYEVYDCTTPDLSPSPCDDSVPNTTSQMIVEMCRDYWRRGSHIETLELLLKEAWPRLYQEVCDLDANVAAKVKLLKPDFLVFDHFFASPSLLKLNIPWARVWSGSPLHLHGGDRLPQAFLGLPTEWDRKNPQHVEWNSRAMRVREKLYQMLNSYWTSQGFPDLPTEPLDYFPNSPYLNIYMFPEELDYSEKPAKNWQRCDCLIRDHKANKFELPEKLLGKPGKLIFLSMGSLASADAVLMRRLTSMLADCPHRFIVVTGVRQDEYELPDNMWGGEFLPQLDILPIIDLIITHGGNNTLTESFFYGVPGFIVCPLFGDQPDNAQRMQEKGFGIRLDPYSCTKEELHGAIEEVLNRPGLRERIQAISERMRQPDRRNRPLKLIDDFVNKRGF